MKDSVKQKLLSDMNGFLDNILIKYDMFLTNKQYRYKHFKTEQEYIKLQKEMGEQIEELERRISNSLRILFLDFFKEVEFISYDSRFISKNNGLITIGKILIKNLPTKDDIGLIKERFENLTTHKILVDRLEDLDEEEQKIILQGLQH